MVWESHLLLGACSTTASSCSCALSFFMPSLWITASTRWRSRQRLAGHHRVSELAFANRGECSNDVWVEVGPRLLVCASRAISHATVATGGSPHGHCAVTPRTERSGLLSSSLSSYLDDRQEFHEPVHASDEAHQCYSDTTREVS